MLALTICLVLPLFGICAGDKPNSVNVSCNRDGDLKLLNSQHNNGYIDGVVLLCEEGTWRTVHDSHWTIEDRTVACRQLGYQGSSMVYNYFELNIANSSYQPSGKVVQCNGSESTLLDCMVTNTTTVTAMMTAVFVNCTNGTLNSSSPSLSTESVTRGTPSETARSTPSETTKIKPSSPVPKPSSEERVTSLTSSSTRDTPSPDPPSSSPKEKSTFLTPLISGVLGGLATLIGVTVLISGIFIVATRTKGCRANKHKRNSDDDHGNGLYKESAYTQQRKDATNPHVYNELEHLYDVIHEPPKSSAQGCAKDTVADNPEPYLVLALSGQGVETGAQQYASLERSMQYATLEAFTGGSVPKTFASSVQGTTPNGTYSHLHHGTPAPPPPPPPSMSEPNSGDPEYSEIPVRPERTVTMNSSVRDQEMVQTQIGKYGTPWDGRGHEYAVLEPVSTEWEIDDLDSTRVECLYQKHSLNTAGQRRESNRTSSELSTGTDV